MSAKRKFILTNLLGVVGAIVLYFMMAKQAITFHLFGLDMASSPGALIFIAYVVGSCFGATSVVPYVTGNHADNVEKLKAWQTQDAKLALEVQMDKERQLEAKIATLEAALKKALLKD